MDHAVRTLSGSLEVAVEGVLKFPLANNRLPETPFPLARPAASRGWPALWAHLPGNVSRGTPGKWEWGIP